MLCLYLIIQEEASRIEVTGQRGDVKVVNANWTRDDISKIDRVNKSQGMICSHLLYNISFIIKTIQYDCISSFIHSL